MKWCHPYVIENFFKLFLLSSFDGFFCEEIEYDTWSKTKNTKQDTEKSVTPCNQCESTQTRSDNTTHRVECVT